MITGDRFYYGAEVVTTRGLVVPNAPSSVVELASQLLDDFEADVLARGMHQVEGTTVLWAVLVEGQTVPELVTRTYGEDGAVWAVREAPQSKPRPDILADAERQAMERLDSSDLYVAARGM